MITVGSLFSGIGGLDLGLERAGMKVIWQAETDPYASKVLAKHWPDVPNLGDVTKVDWDGVERPDLVCGGYPCQPFSHAGLRAGAADARHLWPHFATALRLLRPRWALLENVPGHLSLGFADVLSDLAALGFDAEWDLLPAAAVGAPHRRYRLFVVAHTAGAGHEPEPRGVRPDEVRRNGQVVGDEFGGGGSNVADTQDPNRRGAGLQVYPRRWDQEAGRRSLRRAGLQHWLAEPDVGRVAHGIPRRVDRLRCLGNAVVPQVAEFVGRLILEADCHCGCHQTVQPGLIPCPSCATNPDHSSRSDRPEEAP